jgi:hypothetical protein
VSVAETELLSYHPSQFWVETIFLAAIQSRNMSGFDELKSSVAKSGSSFQSRPTSRMSVINDVSKDSEVFFEEEYIIHTGQRKKVKRLYVRKAGHGVTGTGWIMNEDINNCMICGSAFGFFLYKHHCRSCGHIVCDPCSPHRVVIKEMTQMGEQRVCVLCFWGQDPVHAAHWKTDFDSDEEGSEVGGKLRFSLCLRLSSDLVLMRRSK